MGTQATLGWRKGGKTDILKRLIFTLESRPNWFFITLALCGFHVVFIAAVFFLNGFFFFFFFFFFAWQPWLWQLQIWHLHILFHPSHLMDEFLGRWTEMPPLSWNHHLCLGGEDYLPDLKCSQLAATDSMITAQVTLPSLLKCKRSGARPPCGMQTLFIHFLLLTLDIITGNITYWGSCFFSPH